MKVGPMECWQFRFVRAGFLLLTALNGLAEDIKVIANPSIPTDTISTQELKRVFLGEKNSLGSAHVEPVLEKGGAAHLVFLREYLRQSDIELQSYYGSLVFTGRASMPKILNSDAEVVAYVASTKGAIGYVSADIPTEGVKVLTIVDARSGSERRLISRVEPDYPPTLRQLHIGGTVRLQITITPRGTVEKVQLLGGNPILAEAAIEAVKKWEYAAGSRTVSEVSISFDPDRN